MVAHSVQKKKKKKFIFIFHWKEISFFSKNVAFTIFVEKVSRLNFRKIHTV